jgi:hypothetical protein
MQPWAILKRNNGVLNGLFAGVIGLSMAITLPVHAELDVPLSRVIRPASNGERNATQRQDQLGRPNIAMMLINTLFVVGCMVLVVKHPLFRAWAGRVRWHNTHEGLGIYRAIWKAFQSKNLPENTAVPSFASALATPSRPIMGARPEGVGPETWLEYLDKQTLPDGISLYWVRIEGVPYVLAESPNGLQWLNPALPPQGQVAVAG